MFVRGKWKQGLTAVLCAAMLVGSLATDALTVQADTGDGSEPVTCTCATLCTDDAIDTDCPVCGAEDADIASVCTGKTASDDSNGDKEAPTSGTPDGGKEADTCNCTTKCTEEDVNDACKVCKDDYALCTCTEEGGTKNQEATPQITKAPRAGENNDATMKLSDLFVSIGFGPSATEDEANYRAMADQWPSDVNTNASGVLVFNYEIKDNAKPVAGKTYSMNLEGAILPGGTSSHTDIPIKSSNEAGVEKIVAYASLANYTDDKGEVQGVTVSIKYEEGVDAEYLETGVKGYFVAGASFNKDKLGNGGQQTITLKDSDGKEWWSQPISFKETLPEQEVALTKTRGTITPPTSTTNGSIVWTLEATITEKNLPDGLGQTVDLVVTDTLPAGLSVDIAGATAVTTETGAPGTNTEISKGTNTDGTTTLTITRKAVPLTSGQQTVKFTVKTTFTQDYLDENQKDAKISWTNDADADVDFPEFYIDNGAVKVAAGKTIHDHDDATATADLSLATITKEKGVIATGSERVTGRFVVKWTIQAGSSVYTDLMVHDVLDGKHTYLIDDAAHPITVTEEDSASTTIASTNITTGTTGTRDASKAGKDTYYAVKASDGKSIDIYVGKNTGTKTITYYTIMEQNADETSALKNKADLYYGPGPGTWSTKWASITPGNALLFKSHKDSNYYDRSTQHFDWTITLYNNGYYTSYADNIKITDVFGKDATNTSQVHQELQSLTADVYSEDGTTHTTYTLDSASGKLLNGTTEIGKLTKKSDAWKHEGESADKESGFEIELYKDVLPEEFAGVQVNYTTKLADCCVQTYIDGTNVGNAVSATGNMTATSEGYVKTDVLAKATTGTYNKRTHKQAWKITVNQDNMTAKNLVVTDELKPTTNTNNIQFAPNDWEYVKDSLKIVKTTKAGDSSEWTYNSETYNEATADYKVKWTAGTTSSNPKVEITLAGDTDTDAKYVITYDTELVNTAALVGTTANIKLKALENTASLEGKKGNYTFTAGGKSNTNVDAEILSKTGSYDGDNATTFTWTFTINDRGANLTSLADASGYITLKDELKGGLDYVADSTTIRSLTDKDAGTAATTLKDDSAQNPERSPVISYDETTHLYQLKFKADDLNGKGYEVTIQTTVPTTTNDTYSNAASLEGATAASTYSQSETSARTSFNYGRTFRRVAGRGTVLITKVNSNEKMLEGATYTLLKQTADGKSWDQVDAASTTGSAQDFSDLTNVGGATKNKINLSFINLRYGTYRLVETTAPVEKDANGTEKFTYVKDTNEYEFTLSAQNSVQGYTFTNYSPQENEPITVTVSKQTTAGSPELVGARLTVKATSDVDFANVEVDTQKYSTANVDKTTNTVTWISSSEALEIKNLPAGEYRLTESQAPLGYATSEDIQFKVFGGHVQLWNAETKTYEDQEDKTSKNVTMLDTVLAGTFSKKARDKDGNITGEQAGAQLQITLDNPSSPAANLKNVKAANAIDANNFKVSTDGKTISWTSTTTSLKLTQLPLGEYTMTETTAPQGYAVAESITFKIVDTTDPAKQIVLGSKDKDGDITWDKEGTDTVQMEDKPLKDIKISKVAAGGSKELPGAEMALYEGKYLKGDPKLENLLVVKWISGDKENKDVDPTKGRFDDETGQFIVNGSALKSAQDYTLVEIAAPNGYYVATNITFHIDAEGNITDVSTNASSLTDTSDDKRLIVMADNAIPEGGSDGGEEHEATVVVYKGKASVSKVWNDNDNAVGKRPSSVTVQLYRNGKEYGQPVVLNADNEWYHQWTGLNSASQWTVKEVSTADGYESSYLTGSSENSAIILNTYTAMENTITPGEDNISGEDSSGLFGAGGLGGTGDSSNMMLYLVIMLVAAGTLVTYTVVRRKRQNF